MAEARRIPPVPEPVALTTAEISDRATFYFMRDTTTYKALNELLAILALLEEAKAPVESGGFQLGLAGRVRAMRSHLVIEANQQRSRNLELDREINELRGGIRLMVQGLEQRDPRVVPIELRTFCKKLGLIR